MAMLRRTNSKKARRASLVITAGALALALVTAAGAGATSTTLPSVGTKADGIDLRSVSGATRYGDGYAIPLKAERPSWYTQELARRVHENPGVPVAVPDAPMPGEVGIRPGSWMIAPYGCTMNFVFQNGGSYAIGTAGHCTDNIGQRVVLLTVAPGGSNPVLVDVGAVIARHDNGIGDDFALVSVEPVLNEWVSPTIGVVGGPCGVYSGSGPETVAHYGHGLVIGTGGTPRAGVALTWRADAFGWDGLAIFGDSGSPVRVTDLKAAGDLTHLVVDTRWLPSFIAGTRMSKIQQIAGGWNLKSSSLCL
jgi:hypothetical protein